MVSNCRIMLMSEPAAISSIRSFVMTMSVSQNASVMMFVSTACRPATRCGSCQKFEPTIIFVSGFLKLLKVNNAHPDYVTSCLTISFIP